MKYKNQFIQIDNKTVRQINSISAKKLFLENTEIYFHASNLRLNNMWQNPILIKPKSKKRDYWEKDFSKLFDTICNEFRYYNCDSVRGNSINFFINITKPTIS